MEYLIVLAAILVAVYGAVVARRGGLLATMLLVMLAGICFSVPFFKVPIGSLPVTIDRLLLVVLVGQYLVWRWLRLADPKPWGPAEWTLAALSAVLAFSTLRGDWRADAYQPVAWLIVSYAMPIAIYLVARQAQWDEGREHVLLGAIAIFGLYLAAITVAEYLQLWGALFPRYIAATAAEAGTEFVGRGRGPLLNPIGNGVMLCTCFAASLMHWPRLPRWGKLLLLAGSLLFVAAIYATLTRSVWMSGILTLAIVVGLSLPARLRLPVLGGGLVLTVALAGVFWESILTYKRDRDLEAGKAAESAALRPVLAMIAWNMFLDRPILGCGYGQYQRVHLEYTADRSSGLPLEAGRGYVAHNVFLGQLTENGMVGLGLFLALGLVWGLDAWRLWSDARLPLWARQQGLLLLTVLGVYFLNGMFHDLAIVPMANMLLFFVAGVTAGLRPLTEPWAWPLIVRRAQVTSPLPQA
ncbi:MAG: O-antigen ligase family protein [Planctomycetota bacterium]